MVDYLSSQPQWAGYQVSTKQGSGPEVVYLKDADGDVDFDVLDRLDVTLCSHRAPEYFGYRGWLPADLPLIFEVNYDGWALTGVGDTTTE